jgi:hypothetical protein
MGTRVRDLPCSSLLPAALSCWATCWGLLPTNCAPRLCGLLCLKYIYPGNLQAPEKGVQINQPVHRTAQNVWVIVMVLTTAAATVFNAYYMLANVPKALRTFCSKDY